MKFDGDNLVSGNVIVLDSVFGLYVGAWTGGEKTLSVGRTHTSIRFKITLQADANNTPVRLTSMIIESILIEDVNWIDTLTFRVADRDKDLNGDYDDYQDHSLKLTQLETWATTPTALTMRSVVKQLDNKTVFIEEGGMRLHHIVTEEGNQAYLCQLQVYEVS